MRSTFFQAENVEVKNDCIFALNKLLQHAKERLLHLFLYIRTVVMQCLRVPFSDLDKTSMASYSSWKYTLYNVRPSFKPKNIGGKAVFNRV